jgi:alpha-tubulin suppressor-like RCC1 family protein
MADDRFDPGFEQRLAGELGGLADEGTRPFDASEISSAAIGRAARRQQRPAAASWLQSAMVVAVVVVALVAVGIAGGFIKLPNNDLLPNPSYQPFTAAPSGEPTPIASPTSHALPPTIVPATPTPTAIVTTPPVTPAPTPSPTPTPSLEPSPSGEPTPSPSPTIAPVDSVVKVAVGDAHACALANDGRIFCWGANDMGQLGDGSTEYRDFPTLSVVGIGKARAVAAGIRFSCAALKDGTVWCWGEDPGSDGSSAVPWQVAGIDDATDVVAGGVFACALRAGGSVVCWGDDTLGQLGNGSFDNNAVSTPQAVLGIDDAIEISAGWNHACAVRSDHSLWCWGGNGDGATGYGQLGDGTFDNSAQPVQVVGLDNVVHVSAGGWTTCAVRTDGSAWCWGYGQQGGLGDGNGSDSNTPVSVTAIDDARLVAVGDFHACASRADGSVWCWGDTSWASATGGPALTPVEGNKAPNLVPRRITTGGKQYAMFVDQRGRLWWWGFGTNQRPELWQVGP